MFKQSDMLYGRYGHEPLDALRFKLVIFIIWPFGAWLYSIKTANTKSSMVIFLMFSLLVCWHFSPTGYNDRYADLLGIIDRFNGSTFTASMILQEIGSFFSFSEDAPKELYEHILIWFTKSLAGNNYHFYFLFAAIPVAVCHFKAVKIVVTDPRFSPSVAGLVVLLMLILPRDIITVQNPRFVTGFWICVICTIFYYCKRKSWIYAIPIFISPFFHSGMWVYVGLFAITLFIPKFTKIFQIIAICTIPFIFFDADLFANFDVSFLPPGIQRWTERCMSEAAYSHFILNEGKSGFWWVQASFKFAMKIAYVYVTISMVRNYRTLEQNCVARKIYPFYLILFAAVNMIQFIPILGERYFWFTRIFCILVWFKAFFHIPSHRKELYILLGTCFYDIVTRYGYFLGGVLSTTTAIDLYYSPLPYLMGRGLCW